VPTGTVLYDDSMDLSNVYAVVLAGGQSSRLFPFNKVLSDLTGSGRSLLQQAYDRATRRFISREHFFVLTDQAAVPAMRKQLRLAQRHFYVDPQRRGTWPALMWAMAHLRRQDPAATLAVLPGDQVMPNSREFRQVASRAIQIAQDEPAVVLLGTTPSKNPSTWLGFGCFKAERGCITAFREKPSLEDARRMTRERGWYWNSGMFFFRLSTAEAALRHYQPAMWDIYERMAQAIARRHESQASRLYAFFPASIPYLLNPARRVDNTIDYALLTPMAFEPFEGARPCALTGVLSGWSDLGEWKTLRTLMKPDRRGNIRLGKVYADSHTRDCILAADAGCHVDARGLRGLVVAFSSPRSLIIPESEVGRVKSFVSARQGNMVTTGLKRLKIILRGRRLSVVSSEHGFIR